jgi:hypothetical protein
MKFRLSKDSLFFCMKNYLSLITHLLLFLLSGLFCLSGFVKLFPVELFEYTFVDLGLANWHTAPFTARLFIGFELIISMVLLIPMRKYLIPGLFISFIFLLVMSVYLVWQWILHGNLGNCGCFGMLIPMTPLQSLIKNLAMLVLCMGVYAFRKNLYTLPKLNNLLFIFLTIVSVALPFVLNPVTPSKLKSHSVYKGNLELSLLESKPTFDFEKGKNIVAFLSLTCPHCKLAAFKLSLMKKQNPELPVFFFLNGDKENEARFFAETHADKIPHAYMSMKEGFIENAGNSLPAIYYVNKQRIEKKTNYLIMRQEEIEQWLTQP